MTILECFSVELIDAVNRWMIDSCPENAVRLDRMAGQLPIEFRSRDEPVYRRVALGKKSIWNLLGDECLLEKISSWTLSEEVAKTFANGVPPKGEQGVIFRIAPSEGRTVINLARLLESDGFRSAVVTHAGAVNNLEYGIGEFRNAELEVLIDCKSVHPDRIVSFGGYSGSKEEIIRLASLQIFKREPSVEDQDYLERCLSESKFKLGARWLTEQQVQAIRQHMEGPIDNLRLIKQIQNSSMDQ